MNMDMHTLGHVWAQIIVFILLLVCLTPLLGSYIASIIQRGRTFLHPILQWLERFTYKISGINPNLEMSWKEYLKALLWFNFFGLIFLFLIQLIQQTLPLNPQNFPDVSAVLAFNTAISFVTNTNWQSYAGETTLSYLTQMMGLAVQNFLSAATGATALFALVRGIIRKESNTIGNFWSDLVRIVIYLLLPLSIILALFLIGQGTIQNFNPYIEVTTLENAKQTIPQGPVASQIAIKQLGTNGGGFFNTNSAHPYENPSALSNFFEMLAIFLIPAALTYTYGKMIGSKRHGWMLFFLMLAFWAIGLVISFFSESLYNPILSTADCLEGKETRLGITNSLIWTVSTTCTGNGSVNTMFSSLSPLTGGVAMFNMMLGELIFGGVGVGLCSMIMFILLTVFLSGLMVGRTPEYLGKKIEKKEIQWVMVSVLTPGVLILIGSGIFCVLPEALSSLDNQGPHGLTEIIYTFTSTAANNGSAFAGLNANTNLYNIVLGFVMLFSRLAIIVPSIALAGLLANKKFIPPSIGTFSVNTALFLILLASVILIVGSLTFFPALSLGPLVEHLLMREGRSF